LLFYDWNKEKYFVTCKEMMDDEKHPLTVSVSLFIIQFDPMNLHTTPSGNFASLRTQLFVDSLQIQLNSRSADSIMGILRDEKGMICRQLQTTLNENASELSWKGLEDLPYGIYTLQLSQGENEVLLRLVKRV
jgi:hypothetical protein